MILSESKVNISLKKLLSKYPSASELIRSIYNIAKNKTEYIPYIERNLDNLIDSYGGDYISEYSENRIYEMFSFFIPWFDLNKKRITKDDIIDASKIYSNKKEISPSTIDGMASDPSNINNYDDIEFVEILIKVVEGKKNKRDRVKELKPDNPNIIYQGGDDNFIVHITSLSESCYYNRKSKWCKNEGFHKTLYYYLKKGELYLSVTPKRKSFIFRDFFEGDTIYLAEDGMEVTRDISNGFFDKVVPKITTFKGLRLISKGRTKKLQGYFDEIDPLIYKVKFETPLGQSKIYIDEKKFIGAVASEDDYYVMSSILSGRYEFTDYYREFDDFKEGYSNIFSVLNEENNDILSKIEFLIVGNRNDNSDQEEINRFVANFLTDNFYSEVGNIISEYVSMKDTQMSNSAREDLQFEINKVLSELNFEISGGYAISTVSNLIFLYISSGKINMDLKKLIESLDIEIDFNSDDMYNYESPNKFDTETYNRDINRYLSNILEKMEEDDSFDLIRYVFSNFKLNTWVPVPSNKNIQYQISGVDRGKNKIDVALRTNRTSKYHSFSKEDFIKFLHNPEIFSIFEI